MDIYNRVNKLQGWSDLLDVSVGDSYLQSFDAGTLLTDKNALIVDALKILKGLLMSKQQLPYMTHHINNLRNKIKEQYLKKVKENL